MSGQQNLVWGLWLKDRGMALAADARISLLERARTAAIGLSLEKGSVTADDVSKWLANNGLPQLGPAAGSLFKGKHWKWTGEWHKSRQVLNHGRLQRVWRYDAV